MVKIGAAGIVSLVVAGLGVLFFVLAVSGVLFEEATPANDIGLWTVTLVFLAIGLLGFWAHIAQRRQEEERGAQR
jgi:protein-S-isoprenylcysteine O-methyltransferase Ste14